MNPEKYVNNRFIRLVINNCNYSLAILILRWCLFPFVLPKKRLRQIKQTVANSLDYFFNRGEEELKAKSEKYTGNLKLKMQEDILLLNYNFKNAFNFTERKTEIDNREIFSGVLNENRGIILAGSHIGSIFPASFSLLNLYMKTNAKNHPGITVCTEPEIFHFPSIWNILSDVATNGLFTLNTINTAKSKRVVAGEMISALKSGQLLFANLDVVKGGKNKDVFTFLNKSSIYLPALVGIAKIALHTNSIVLPWLNYRNKKGGVHIKFERPITWHINSKTPDIQNIEKMKNELFILFENWIKQYPEQWIYWDRFSCMKTPGLKK